MNTLKIYQTMYGKIGIEIFSWLHLSCLVVLVSVVVFLSFSCVSYHVILIVIFIVVEFDMYLIILGWHCLIWMDNDSIPVHDTRYGQMWMQLYSNTKSD